MGCLLMGLCVLWAQENGLLTEERVQQLRTAVNERDVEGIGESAIVDEIKPLSLPIIGPFFDSALPGGAGLLLFILAMFGGWRMSLFALPAAAIMVFGPHLIEVGDDLAFWRKWIFLVIGLAIGIAGIMYGQTVDDRVRDNE
jgi:hypothetical protein